MRKRTRNDAHKSEIKDESYCIAAVRACCESKTSITMFSQRSIVDLQVQLFEPCNASALDWKNDKDSSCDQDFEDGHGTLKCNWS